MSNLSAADQSHVRAVTRIIKRTLREFAPVEFAVVDPTEHPHLVSTCRQDHGGKIYQSCVKRIFQADVAVTIVAPSATGVGIMSELHADATIPRIAIAADDASVSRMYTGLPAALLGEAVISCPVEEVGTRLSAVLHDSWLLLAQWAPIRRKVIDRIAGARIAHAFHVDRIRHRQSLDAFIEDRCKSVHIEKGWLRAIASSPELTPTLTLMQLMHVAQALDWEIMVGSTGIPRWDASRQMPREHQLALSNLVRACEALDWCVPDDRVFAEWSDCEQGMLVGKEGSFRVPREYTVDGWKERLAPTDLFGQ